MPANTEAFLRDAAKVARDIGVDVDLILALNDEWDDGTQFDPSPD